MGPVDEIQILKQRPAPCKCCGVRRQTMIDAKLKVLVDSRKRYIDKYYNICMVCFFSEVLNLSIYSLPDVAVNHYLEKVEE